MPTVILPKRSGLAVCSHEARAGAFYFSFMAANGAIGAFLYLLYREHGLAPSEIGIVIAMTHVMNFVVSPTWGMASDAMERRRGPSLLMIACLGAAPAILLVQAAYGLLPMVLAVVVWGFFGGSIISLADAATMRMLDNDRHAYGRVRVWGSLGSVIASMVAGQLGNRLGMGISFPLYTLMMLLCALLALSFPRARFTSKQSFSSDMLKLLSHPRVVFFLGAILLIGVGYMNWNSTFSLYLSDLGANPGLIGAFYGLSSAVQIPVQATSALWLDALGARRSLIAAFALLAVFWVSCSFLPLSGPLLAIPLALVHGLAFGVYQVAGVVYVSEVTSPEHAGLAQGAYGSFSRGLGSILGSLTSGFLFQSIGGGSAYRISALVGLLALACLWLIPVWTRRRAGAEE